MKELGPFGDGSFASVAACDGRTFLAYQTDPRVSSQIRIFDLGTGNLVRAYDAGVGAAFPLLKPSGLPLMVAWRRADSWRIHYGWPLLEVEPGDLGDVGANNEPFAWSGDWLYWQDLEFQIKRANVVAGMGRDTLDGQRGRGTGIARIVDGRAILRDVERHAYGLTFPNYDAPGYVALEGNTGGLAVVREADQAVARAWFPRDSFTPRVIPFGTGVLACTSGAGAVRAVILDAADFAAGPIKLPTPTDPPPVVTPPPDPPPPVKEPTVSQLDSRVVALRDEFDRVFPWPVPVSEDEFRQRNIRFVRNVVARFPADGYGLKSSSAGGSIGKDTIAQQRGRNLFCWDLYDGVGTGRPKAATPGFHDIGPDAPKPDGGQTFRSVDEFDGPKDFLAEAANPPATDPKPTDPATPPPATIPPELAAALQQLAEINGHQLLILSRIADRLDAPAPTQPVDVNLDALRTDVHALRGDLQGFRDVLMARLEGRIRVAVGL